MHVELGRPGRRGEEVAEGLVVDLEERDAQGEGPFVVLLSEVELSGSLGRWGLEKRVAHLLDEGEQLGDRERDHAWLVRGAHHCVRLARRRLAVPGVKHDGMISFGILQVKGVQDEPLPRLHFGQARSRLAQSPHAVASLALP